MSRAARALVALRRRWLLYRLDRQAERHRRATFRELQARLGPHTRRGDLLAPTIRRVPPDDRPLVMELLGRVDLGPGGPDVCPIGQLYDLLDDFAGPW